MEIYQTESNSCQKAQIKLLEGNLQGTRFLLYENPKFLKQLKTIFEDSIAALHTIKAIAHSQATKDAIDSQVKLIQQSKKNYQTLEVSHEERLVIGKKFSQVGDKVTDVLELFDTHLRQSNFGNEHISQKLIAYFYEIRIQAWKFDIVPTVQVQEKFLTDINTLIDHAKKSEPELIDTKSQKLLRQIITNATQYKDQAKKYTDHYLNFYKDVAKTGKTITAAKQKIDALLEQVLENQDNKQERYKKILLLVSLAVLLLGLGISFGLTRNVLKQLGRDPGVLVQASEKVIAGDFNINDNGPKIGVYGTFVDMVKNLEDNIAEAKRQTELAREESDKAQEAMKRAEEAQKVAECAKKDGMLHAAQQLEGIVAIVSSASEQLSAQIEQSSKGAEEQAQRVSETATAMEEMNGAVLEVARNSGQASELSAQAREKAQTGAKIVGETGESMTVLQQQSEALKADMNELDEHATSISQIMGVISDIADQTNLLALNAAIEAARAGEAGRGFAVVADEVRKLAEKTMDSTADVSKAITEIQESATKNIRQVERTGTVVEQVMEKAKMASDALGEIVTLVDDSSDQVRAIATASEEQSATSEEINRSVMEVNTISRETSQAMREAAQAVVELSNQAQELNALIQKMKACE